MASKAVRQGKREEAPVRITYSYIFVPYRKRKRARQARINARGF